MYSKPQAAQHREAVGQERVRHPEVAVRAVGSRWSATGRAPISSTRQRRVARQAPVLGRDLAGAVDEAPRRIGQHGAEAAAGEALRQILCGFVHGPQYLAGSRPPRKRAARASSTRADELGGKRGGVGIERQGRGGGGGDAREIGGRLGPAGRGRGAVGHAGVGVADELDPVEAVGAAEVGAVDQRRAGRAGPVAVAQVGAEEGGAAERRAAQEQPARRGAAEARPAEVGIAEVGAVEPRGAQRRVGEAAPRRSAPSSRAPQSRAPARSAPASPAPSSRAPVMSARARPSASATPMAIETAATARGIGAWRIGRQC